LKGHPWFPHPGDSAGIPGILPGVGYRENRTREGGIEEEKEEKLYGKEKEKTSKKEGQKIREEYDGKYEEGRTEPEFLNF
jgi:hypothetical protein